MSPTSPKTNTLFLYPTIPDWTIDSTSLIETLTTIELIAQKIPNTDNCFYVGKQFLQQITFLGCAPTIQFCPTDDNPDFCFIQLSHFQEVTMIKTKSLVRSPHCPHCKKTVSQWQTFNLDKAWLCPHCETSSYAHEYNWRRSAGFARTFISISDIYPKEAIPQPNMLAQLASQTNVEWDYFYYCA